MKFLYIEISMQQKKPQIFFSTFNVIPNCQQPNNNNKKKFDNKAQFINNRFDLVGMSLPIHHNLLEFNKLL